MDLTPLFNTSLQKHSSSTSFKPLRAHPFDVDTLNSFLQEAYRIHGHIVELTRYLRSIRAPYLALGPHRPGPSAGRQKHHANGASKDQSRSMTDEQRELIDSETRTALSTLSTSIQDLRTVIQNAAAIQSRVAAKARSKRGLGALGRWAAGSDVPARTPEEIEEEAKIETERLYREGVIYYLQKELEAVSEAQRTMVAVRLQRTVEKNKSVLYKANLAVDAEMLGGSAIERRKFEQDLNGGAVGASNVVLLEEEERRKGLDQLLSPEQVQMFESEQEDMVRYFNSELQKIRHVEESLVEISQLQTHLAMNLEQQTESIDQLVQDSISTTENIGSGNKELKKASERSSTAKMVFYATCAFCTTLIVWDLII